ncbi:bifunctional adenosylcobinamide kinase/adenosylcobinamide-phosphate guanylyltransferase [Gayadomonas joobiniege]|uniref:bifunctional adenosylcobinamide kinase/adenosylcobinamide-phosphate guanylyltransferase n=1 Tax=Gayadomonas joobiniege TaxID=1234606 RepID=UPI000361F180|nr:bifunctional adenosylcobinamide kinase/adenosylcobinamide-phosphate guanylyltransferase [Gayadomonas joobiniege]
MIEFIIGGARSGKSNYAESLALSYQKQGHPVCYIATAEVTDSEMSRRIEKHQQQRSNDWILCECPLELAKCIAKQPANSIVLIDCLTLWLNNLIYYQPDENFEAVFKTLAINMQASQCHLILVANEVGLGLVSEHALGRLFVDQAGRLNQIIAQVADRVVFMAAGLPMFLKGAP